IRRKQRTQAGCGREQLDVELRRQPPRLRRHARMARFHEADGLRCHNSGRSMTHDKSAEGGPGTSGELLPEVYDELRKLAGARLARERQRHQTLEPTALVHEAYLRVSGEQEERRWDRRGHFFAAAAQAMRRILVERARHYQRIKHGSGADRVDLDSAMAGIDP